MKERVMGELKKIFRPELLNRIDEVIVFHKLAKEEILEIVELMMRRVREQISTHEVAIELSDAAKELLVEKGYDPAMGARPLRRAIQRYIEDPLADFVLGSDLKPGVTIVVDRTEGDEEVSIKLAGGSRKREKVAVPAAPEDAPEDDPEDASAE
jgi:ATP-dependent Clp protease ATP-binding subunit ClpC